MKKAPLFVCTVILFSTFTLGAAAAQEKGPNFLLITGLIVIFIVVPTVFFGFFTKKK